MTALLVAILGLLAAHALYLAVLSARRTPDPAHHLDGGGTLPGWTMMFAGAGIVLAGLGVHDHILLAARYGLQYVHVGLGLVVVALTGALVQKRLWLAARLTRIGSPVGLLAAYYGSTGLRVLGLGLVLLFAVPVSATSLSTMAGFLDAATGGGIPRAAAVWVVSFFLFLASALGGWRGVVYAVAAQSLLVLALLAFTGGLAASGGEGLASFAHAIAVPAGTLADRIPGVIQMSAGLGKDVATGGPWTTAAILSFGMALGGLVLSPAFLFLSINTATRTGFAVTQVWMVAALGGGLLLLLVPVLSTLAATGGAPSLAGILDRLQAVDGLASVCFAILLVVSLEIGIAVFTAAGAGIVTLDVLVPFVLPGVSGAGRRLANRVTLAVLYAALALLAAAAPLPATILSSATLGLSVQILPAVLGLLWVPWISRGAVLTGLVFGLLVVVFTEPPGLVLFEGLFLDLPWGRWPLTVHSAAWGLGANLAACLIVSIFTRGGEERAHRDRLHRALGAFPPAFGGPAGRGARWSLVLIWAFLALGPGAILGNDFFSHPLFTEGEAVLGVPSLLVWQILFWFAGVLLVWWLAYPSRMSVLDAPVLRTLDLAPAPAPLARRRVPGWIALLLERVARRPALSGAPRGGATSHSGGAPRSGGTIGKRHGR